MYILNLEDNVIKHHDICRAIRRGSFKDLSIDWVEYLNDGLQKIEESIKSGHKYDLIITDMWYPEKSGGGDAQSGAVLIEEVRKRGWDIPVILCSSADYSYPDIFGTFHYSENEDWETELVKLIKQIK